MQQSKVRFIALARELLDNVCHSLALERSGNVSSARTRGGAKANLVSTQFNPHTYVGWLNPGSTRIWQYQISADRVWMRVQPGLNPGSRACVDWPLEYKYLCIYMYLFKFPQLQYLVLGA